MFADFLSTDGVKIEYVVHMPDIGAIIERQTVLRNLSRTLSNTNDFAYDKYHTIEEIHAWVDEMVAAYPDLVTPLTIGKSYENRDIKGFKISSKTMATKRDGTKINLKKAVWWDGGLLWFLSKLRLFLIVSIRRNSCSRMDQSSNSHSHCLYSFIKVRSRSDYHISS
jgi:hypothetical protein